MDSPTQAQIERALAIVKAHYPEMPASYRGRRYQIALAAIIETQEACAKIAQNSMTGGDGDFRSAWIAAAIRELKGTLNAE